MLGPEQLNLRGSEEVGSWYLENPKIKQMHQEIIRGRSGWKLSAPVPELHPSQPWSQGPALHAFS